MSPQPIGGTLEEWVAWWEEHLCRHVPGSSWRKTPGSEVLFNPDHGFMEWSLDRENDGIIIHAMCGDGRYWEEATNDLGRTLGVSKIFFFTRRDPRPYVRRYGARVYGVMLEREVR